MIASPSDVIEERQIIREVISDWNIAHSESRQAVLLPVGWETHSYPEMGEEDPQTLLDKQILQDCDLLIGVFWTRIGTATPNYQSGTVEEIEEHLKAKKPALLYFSNAPINPERLVSEQYEQLKKFKNRCQPRGLYHTYSDIQQFKESFSRHLQLKLNQYLPKAGTTQPEPQRIKQSPSEKSLAREILDQLEEKPISSKPNRAKNLLAKMETSEVQKPSISPEAQKLLKECSKSDNGMIFCLIANGEIDLSTNAIQFADGNATAREIALWEDALKQLENQELIEAISDNHDIFKITHKGYKVADS